MRRLLIAPAVLLVAAVVVGGCKPSTQTSPQETSPAQQPPAPPVSSPNPTTGPKPGPAEPNKPAVELKAIKTFPICTKFRLFDIALSPDGATAVAHDDKEDGPHLWETATGKVIAWQDADTAKYFKGSVTGPVFSSDGSRLWTVVGVPLSLGDYAIISMNTKTHKIEESIPATWGQSSCLALSPDEKLLATSWAVYDLKTKKSQFEFGKELRNQRALAFSHDGKMLVGRDDKAITIWNVETGKVAHTIPFKKDAVSDKYFLAVSPKTNVFATRVDGGTDGGLEIRDLETGDVKVTYAKGPNLAPGGLAWSADGKYLTVAVDLGFVDDAIRKAIWVLDGTSGKPLASLSPTLTHSIDAIAFSGDSTKLAIITETDNEPRAAAQIVLWDLGKLPK